MASTEHILPTELRQPEHAEPGRPRTNAGDGVRAHPILIVLVIIVLAAGGAVVGSRKPRTYSAQATINVGKSDIATQATPGYVVAAEALASSYSRLVSSDYVIRPSAAALGASPASIASRLSAVPIPNEPTFTITAQGSSTQRAVRLANLAVRALLRYVSNSITSQGGPSQLLARYQAAQATADELQARAQRLQRQLDGTATSTITATTPTQPGVTRNEVIRAKVIAQSAALQAQGLSSQYLNLAQTTVAPQLDVLTNATGASSNNRIQNIEKYGIIGAAAGLIIGLALATLVGMIETRRSRRAGAV